MVTDLTKRPGKRWQSLRRRAFLPSLACLLAMSVAGCVGTANQSVPTTPNNNSGSASPDVSPEDWLTTVDWSGGRDVAGMADGVPNPAGWYRAAFGGPSQDKVLYLTFDDGPWPPTTDAILNALAANQANATFFVVGNQVRAHPEYVQQILDQGHAIGNHTMTHADLIASSREEVRAELSDTTKLVGSSRMGDCMRPPYGLIDQKVAAVAHSLNLMPILWTGHAQDWDPPGADQMIQMLKDATHPGAVILLHDGGGDKPQTVSVVKQMLPWWKQQGYTFATVPACRK